MIVGLMVLAGTAWVLTRPPVPPPDVVDYTPRQAQAAQEHISAVRAALTQPAPGKMAAPADPAFVQHIRQARGPDVVRLQLSQADLNAYFATEPHIKVVLAQHHITAVQMLLRKPRGIVVRATIVRGGHPYNVQIETVARVDPKAGLQVTATGAQVGRLPLPPALVTAQASKAAAQITGKMQGRLPLVLRDVRVEGDKLVLLGTARGPKPRQ